MRWRVQPAPADELFLDYRDFDPLAPENSDGVNVQALADRWSRSSESRTAGRSEIINVIAPLVNYDEATRSRMNALNVEKANTRVAVTNHPSVLASNCLDAAREAHISPLGC